MKDVPTARPARKPRPASEEKGRSSSAKKVPRKPKASRLTQSATVPAPAPSASSSPKAAERLVRDSFTMPRSDLQLIEELKARAIAFYRPAKKSELLRAGLHALAALDDEQLRARLDALTRLKPGRPRKSP